MLVHVGRVAFKKNIDFLLRMMRYLISQLPNALLVIAGEGPSLRSLRSLSRDLDIEHNVMLIGYLDRKKELLDCYRAANVFVFSSRTETQGLLLEAMAKGTPVVSTSYMGIADILSAGKGALVANEHIEDFADKTIRLLKDAGLRRQLGREASQYVMQWSAGSMASKMLDFYRDVIERH